MRRKCWKDLSIVVAMAVMLAGCGAREVDRGEAAQGEAKQQQEVQKGSEVRASFAEKNQKKTGSEEKKDEKKEADVSEAETETETETEMEIRDTEELRGDAAIIATEGKFDYVALGNSVTANELSELWWSNWGMAATTEENDYVHIVSRWLEGQSEKPVTTTVLDIKKWEVAPDRMAALDDYDKYFNEHTDLVTLQTGENIVEGKETLPVDYPALLQRIKEKAPNAQILVLGEVLWPKEDIESAKHAACDQTGIPFIDVSDFRAAYEEGTFRSSLGAEVYGSDGNIHAIDNEVVAAHPNDEGMANIAQHFIDNITITN